MGGQRVGHSYVFFGNTDTAAAKVAELRRRMPLKQRVSLLFIDTGDDKLTATNNRRSRLTTDEGSDVEWCSLWN